MTLILKQLFALLKLLNSDKGTNQISSGIALGFILGFSPILSLQGVVVFFCILIFRVQIGAAFASSFFFSLSSFLMMPLFDYVGRYILEVDSLKEIFTSMYNMPIIPFLRFNNSNIMGAGIVSVILAPIIFWISKIIVTKYREVIVEKFKKTKIFKLFKMTFFYKWYAKYEQFYG